MNDGERRCLDGLDTDGDGYSDFTDAFTNIYFTVINQSANTLIFFPTDGTQWNETDGDGHGDNKYGCSGTIF